MYKLNVVLNIINKICNTQLKYNMDPINMMAACLVTINSEQIFNIVKLYSITLKCTRIIV